ncbi:MAG TPA: hypothetical protein VFT16_05240 [Candidatus Saccharimonadales bacterium]|nr:hypothetical protein [Candidatus Saccharimonadales bacterium]
MDPYQQYQAPQQGSPYEFILNPSKPPKKKFGLGGNNFAVTLGLIIGGALIFMIVLTLLLNAVGGKTLSKADLIALAQTENELVRVSQTAAATATQQTTKNLAVTIQFSMLTQQKKTLNFLAQNGVDVDEKELGLKQNATTDQQLASAKTTSTFDLTFSQIMQDELEAYARNLKALNASAANKTESDLTSTFYTQTQLLISQIPYTQDRIQEGAQ